MAQADVSFYDLDIADEEHTALCLLLSADEHKRAGLYHRLLDRRRFEVRRGYLRLALAETRACDPGAIAIALTSEGKPYVAAPAGAPAFSLSHSHGTMALALSSDGFPGIDIEMVAPLLEDIAPVAFTGREQRTLEEMPIGVAREEAALRLWTCKEAVLKATGSGLLVAPTLVDVELQAASAAGDARWGRVRWATETNGQPGVAAVMSFCPRAGIMAAVALAVPSGQKPLDRFHVAMRA